MRNAPPSSPRQGSTCRLGHRQGAVNARGAVQGGEGDRPHKQPGDDGASRSLLVRAWGEGGAGFCQGPMGTAPISDSSARYTTRGRANRLRASVPGFPDPTGPWHDVVAPAGRPGWTGPRQGIFREASACPPLQVCHGLRSNRPRGDLLSRDAGLGLPPLGAHVLRAWGSERTSRGWQGRTPTTCADPINRTPGGTSAGQAQAGHHSASSPRVATFPRPSADCNNQGCQAFQASQACQASAVPSQGWDLKWPMQVRI